MHSIFPVPTSAIELALLAIKRDTADTTLYTTVLSLSPGLNGDEDWINSTSHSNNTITTKLSVELKTYTTNLIKESIRLAHFDLANHFYKIGDIPSAIASLTKSRSFSTTSQHLFQISLELVKISLEIKNYSLTRNHILKAESALESITSANATNGGSTTNANMPGMIQSNQNPLQKQRETEKQIMEEKLAVVNGLAYLGLAQYDKAALAFTSIGAEILQSTEKHFIPLNDIILYAVLTSLATFDRKNLRERLLDNSNFRGFWETEVGLKDVVRAFFESRFKDAFELLSKYDTRMRLDYHLSPHYHNLIGLIKSHSLVSYFAPYSKISFARMSTAFGFSSEEIKKDVIKLINNSSSNGSGKLGARIDDISDELVERKERGGREEVFKSAFEAGEKIGTQNGRLALRMNMIRSEILVKGLKD